MLETLQQLLVISTSASLALFLTKPITVMIEHKMAQWLYPQQEQEEFVEEDYDFTPDEE